jgi:hypothetical protein
MKPSTDPFPYYEVQRFIDKTPLNTYVFFVVNFTASFLYEYFTKGTTLAEFYGTFAFGYIFAFAAVVTALYRTKNKNNE